MYRFAGLRAHTEPFWAPHYEIGLHLFCLILTDSGSNM